MIGNDNKYYGETNSKKEPHGYGCCLYTNGTYYEGEWDNGLRSGKGGSLLESSDMYVGDFLNNFRKGYGTYKSIAGDVYEGGF